MSSIADRVSIFYAGRVVEAGPRADVLQRPRHPYTRALLDALPHPEAARTQPLVAIAGAPPSPAPSRPAARSTRAARTRSETCRARRAAARRRRRRAAVACPVDPLRRPMSALELATSSSTTSARGGGRVRAVAGASLTVERGQIVGLVGESGCGKSTLARAAVGLIAPTAGDVLFEGSAVTPLGRARARPRELVRLQLVFQNPYSSLNPRRKIGAQIARRARCARQRAAPASAPRACRELLELVGLPRGRRRRLSAPVQRRPAPADRDRARAGGRSVGDRARRAARVARRLGPGAARQPARRPLARPRSSGCC